MITRKSGWTILRIGKLWIYWDNSVIPFSWDWR